MDCRIAKGKPEDFKCDALISFVYQDEPVANGLDKNIIKLIKTAIDDGHFKGASCELFQIYPLEGAKAPRLVLVGLGKRAKSSPENIRKAAGTAIRSLRKLKNVAFLQVDDAADTIVPLIDGAILGDYRFDLLKSHKEESKLKLASFFVGKSSVSEEFVEAIQIIDKSTLKARDLANMPANLLTPEALADEARSLGKEHKILR